MMRRIGARMQSLLVLATLAILLGIASPHFLAPDNLLNVLQQSSINALLGIGITFVIIAGGIDLSVGSILALSGLVVADLASHGIAIPLAITAALLVGTACGAISGLVTTLTRIPPFISTLAMMLVARGAAKIYCDSNPISGMPPALRALAGDVFGIPLLAVIVVGAYVLAHFVLTRMRLGRYAYAIGGSEQAAFLCGVPVGPYKVAFYAISGLLAAVSGVLLTARLNAASPLAGEMYELYAIAAAVIGGVSLLGGEGRVQGTLIGALIVGTLRNGLNLLNVPSAWEGVVVGSVLVAAVIIDRARHQRTETANVSESRPRWMVRIFATAAMVALVGGAVHLRTRGTGGSEQFAGDALGKASKGDSLAGALIAPGERPASITLAFIPKAMNSPFWQAMQKGAQAAAEKLGAHLLVLSADRETDVERQYQIVENSIEQRVQAIVLAPSGSKELVPAVLKANRAGIPVFIVDTKLDAKTAEAAGAKTVAFVGSDNLHGGELAAAALGKALGGRGEVAIIEGISGHETADARRSGFLRGLAAFPEIRVVSSQTASWERERGYTVAQNMLQAHPALRGIFAANDEMAMGAVEAVAAARRQGSVLIVGFDANPDAQENIRGGRMLGSVAQFPDEMGRLAVEHAVALVRAGTQPPEVINTRVEIVQ